MRGLLSGTGRVVFIVSGTVLMVLGFAGLCSQPDKSPDGFAWDDPQHDPRAHGALSQSFLEWPCRCEKCTHIRDEIREVYQEIREARDERIQGRSRRLVE